MRYIVEPGTGRLVPRDEYYRRFTSGPGPGIVGDIEPHISPITGEVIGSRSTQRDHFRQHDVVDRREFKGHKFERPGLPPAAPDVAQAFREYRRG